VNIVTDLIFECVVNIGLIADDEQHIREEKNKSRYEILTADTKEV